MVTFHLTLRRSSPGTDMMRVGVGLPPVATSRYCPSRGAQLSEGPERCLLLLYGVLLYEGRSLPEESYRCPKCAMLNRFQVFEMQDCKAVPRLQQTVANQRVKDARRDNTLVTAWRQSLANTGAGGIRAHAS